MNPVTAGAAGLFILAMGEVPNYYSGLLPSLMTIRRFSADDRDTSTLRLAMVGASGFAALVGIGASLISGSPWPILGTLLAMGFLVFGYEWAIRNPHDDATPINRQKPRR